MEWAWGSLVIIFISSFRMSPLNGKNLSPAKSYCFSSGHLKFQWLQEKEKRARCHCESHLPKFPFLLKTCSLEKQGDSRTSNSSLETCERLKFRAVGLESLVIEWTKLSQCICSERNHLNMGQAHSRLVSLTSLPGGGVTVCGQMLLRGRMLPFPRALWRGGCSKEVYDSSPFL